MNDVAWICLPWSQLNLAQVHSLYQLRCDVFVVEQQCIYQDVDGADVQALHVMGWRGNELLAYARCFDAGVKFTEAAFGRVAVAQTARGSGLGHQLVAQVLRVMQATWGVQPIRIHAQAHMQAFYQAHGFHAVGVPFDEDGIAHVAMLRS